MQHVVGCPTCGYRHPNRCWVSKWEHGCLDRHGFPECVHGFPNPCLISKTEHGFPNRCLISQNGNMVFQIDVGCQFTRWVQTMGSNNGFKHNAMHKSGIILVCWMIHSLSAPPRLPSSPPFFFPVVCPLQPLGNSIAGPLHNTAVEHISYVFYIWWCRH